MLVVYFQGVDGILFGLGWDSEGIALYLGLVTLEWVRVDYEETTKPWTVHNPRETEDSD